MRSTVFLVLYIFCGAASADTFAEGARLFRLHCASCHGSEGDTPGPMAAVLTQRPADLTRLSAANEGRFPTKRTLRQIDGRALLPAHGAEMPVYGWFFDGPPAELRDSDGELVGTTEDLAALIAWLQSIQRY